MFLTILLVALAVWAIVGTVIVARRDGYAARPTDWARVAEHGGDVRESTLGPLQRAESTTAYR